ncbi:hypothetical protein C8J57DRAFT_1490726 [Mycena rebaudengoi]|nr:hypothetical protein C8J57DRAFT_1490726 [Mycena rebaudengoi]
MSKTLYVFDRSVWAAVPELAVIELGYTDADVTQKVVNLYKGENFAPSFLKLNPKGTLPTLEANGTVYTSTAEVVANLVKDTPVKVPHASSIVETIHEDKYDPSLALLLARNDAELSAKSTSFAGLLLSNRQAALEKFSKEADGAPYKAFYDQKIAENGGLLAIFKSAAPAEHKAGFLRQGAVFELLPTFLPGAGFIGGETPGEDDFHVIAWLTRIAETVGAKSGDGALAAFEAAYEKPVPAKVAAYWTAWIARPSWQKVYAGGLH